MQTYHTNSENIGRNSLEGMPKVSPIQDKKGANKRIIFLTMRMHSGVFVDAMLNLRKGLSQTSSNELSNGEKSRNRRPVKLR
ncbi:hypothetical protein CEXT_700121 [Caerostris extrusa]|uniref:Uncharacterized protein n=1 Tax=Caerostris extrusa TaxID=172846 RepID=A0AAV4U9R6_CAEEX|nr:hypothetical protein CEXT_700121 [Caerostris extrusa]